MTPEDSILAAWATSNLVTIFLVQIVTHLSNHTNSSAILIPDDEGTDIV